jgi:hypothetical protein
MTENLKSADAKSEMTIAKAREQLIRNRDLYDEFVKATQLGSKEEPQPTEVLKRAAKYVDAIETLEKLEGRLDRIENPDSHWEELDFEQAKNEVLRRIAVYRER